MINCIIIKRSIFAISEAWGWQFMIIIWWLKGQKAGRKGKDVTQADQVDLKPTCLVPFQSHYIIRGFKSTLPSNSFRFAWSKICIHNLHLITARSNFIFKFGECLRLEICSCIAVFISSLPVQTVSSYSIELSEFPAT